MTDSGYFVESGDKVLISRKDIDKSSDKNELKAWLRAMEDKSDYISMQIDGFKMYPTEDPDDLEWMARACQAKAATAIGIHHIRKRMIELGFLDNEQGRQIASMNKKIAELKAKVIALGGEA